MKSKTLRTPRNKFEHQLVDSCKKLAKSKGIKVEYEVTKLPFVSSHNYLADVTLSWPSGRVVLLEGKGYFKSSDRSKMLAVRRDNPKMDIRLVFQRASNKLNKRSKTTYGEWATKHNFIWCEGNPPKSWFK